MMDDKGESNELDGENVSNEMNDMIRFDDGDDGNVRNIPLVPPTAMQNRIVRKEVQ